MTQAHLKRKLTAIFSADVAGYSRLMGADEEATVRTLTRYREILATRVKKHDGSVVDSVGDNLLATFVSVVNAVTCAVAVQKEIAACNEALPGSRRMQFRIGINIGDVIQEKERIYGDGVNIAARLEGLADPGGICISKVVVDHIEGKLPYAYASMGDRTVKNIARPVCAYRVLVETGAASTARAERKGRAARRRAVFFGIVAVVAMAVAGAIWQLYDRPERVSDGVEPKAALVHGKPFIAVLPFENMSDDPGQEYFSDGMTEEIITRLSANPGIFVISRNSTFFYKGRGTTIQQIGRELNARYVVEGSVRKSGNRVRVTAQLIDATTESHIWANTYDRQYEDIFNLQDDIAQQVVAALNIKSREAEQARAWRVPTERLTAYDALLRGVSHFVRLTAEENARAKTNFERAVALDPEYATAHVMMGYTLFMDFVFGTNRDSQILEQVSGMARKALSFDEFSLYGLFALPLVDLYKKQSEKALADADRLVSLVPENGDSYALRAAVLISAGRGEEAIEMIEKAMQLRPDAPAWYLNTLGTAYTLSGRREEAEATHNRVLNSSPSHADAFNARLELTLLYTGSGRIEAARSQARAIKELVPNFSVETWGERNPSTNHAQLEQAMTALRRAGL